MDKIQKALNKFSDKERTRVKEVLVRIQKNQLTGFDIQQLQGHKDIFRVRKGDIRIIYRCIDEKITVMAIERRSEKTYRKF